MNFIEIEQFKRVSSKLQPKGFYFFGWCGCRTCKGGFGFGYVGKKKGWSVKFFGLDN